MINLLTIVDRHRHDLLPQFVVHYRDLGVDRFLISAHVDPQWPEMERWSVIESMASTLAGLGIPEMFTFERTHDAIAGVSHRAALRDRLCSSDDWCVWADIDEFQEYDGTIPEVIRNCRRRGELAVQGWFLDHFAPDGSLAPFDPSRSIWEQFSGTGHITRDVLGAVDSKITLCRADITPVPGCHAIADSQGHWGRGTIGGVPTVLNGCIVHHFKWDAAVVQRLRHRFTHDWQTTCPWWVETQRLFDHLRAHGNLTSSQPAKPMVAGSAT